MTSLELKHELFVANQKGVLSDKAFNSLCALLDTYYFNSRVKYRQLTDPEKRCLKHLTAKEGNVWELRFDRRAEYVNSEFGRYKLIDEDGEVYLYTDKFRDVIMFNRIL